MEIIEDFSSRLSKAMSIRNVRAIDIVNATGISESALSQYISGKISPKRSNLIKIADFLEVNVSWLIGLDVPMELKIDSKTDYDPSMGTSSLLEHSIEVIKLFEKATPEDQNLVEYILNKYRQ